MNECIEMARTAAVRVFVFLSGMEQCSTVHISMIGSFDVHGWRDGKLIPVFAPFLLFAWRRKCKFVLCSLSPSVPYTGKCVCWSHASWIPGLLHPKQRMQPIEWRQWKGARERERENILMTALLMKYATLFPHSHSLHVALAAQGKCRIFMLVSQSSSKFQKDLKKESFQIFVKI